MAYSELLATCHGCDQRRTFRRHNPSHLLHLMLTLLLSGLWLPVWIIAAIYRGPYRCRACGAKLVTPRRPASPFLVVFALVAVSFLIVGLFHGFTQLPSAPRQVTAPPADVAASLPTTTTASGLLAAFRRTPTTAEARYADAELVVNGAAKLVAAADKRRQTWLVFVDEAGEALAQCLASDRELPDLTAHFAGPEIKPVTIRCRLLRFSPDGTLTLHEPQLVR